MRPGVVGYGLDSNVQNDFGPLGPEGRLSKPFCPRCHERRGLLFPMTQYTRILADGTRLTVRYNPRYDGPVSERLTQLRRIRWADHRLQSHPNQIAFHA